MVQSAKPVQTILPKTVLICYVGEHESAHQLLSSLPGIATGHYRQDDIMGMVFASKSSKLTCLETEIPTVYIRYQESLTYSYSAGPDDVSDLRFGRDGACLNFSPLKESFILNVECVNIRELDDCIAWSIHLLAQQGASTTALSKPTFMGLRDQQIRTKRATSDRVSSIDYPIRGLDPHRRWWSTLALFWIAFAERPIDGTELMSALAAAAEDHFPVNSDLFAERLGNLGDLSDNGLGAVLSESLIISETGRIILSSEEAKTALLYLVSGSGGTDEGAIHEMIAYTCLCCIERQQPASILRPWTFMESYLDHQSTSSNLLLYAVSFWHVHFRLGEHKSQRLSALLHRIIKSALSTDKYNARSDGLDTKQIINAGMRLCAFHDFSLLGRTYLEMGAELDACCGYGTGPVHVAASKPSIGVLEPILARKPKLNVVDWEGMTPLHVAAFGGHLAAVKMLLAAGSDVRDTVTASRETTLHIAVRGGNEKIVALLLEQGAEIDALNVLSESPLCIALRKGNYAITKMLVGWGASRLSFPAMGQSVADAIHAFQALSFAEQDASAGRELHQYVGQESARLDIHLRYR